MRSIKRYDGLSPLSRAAVIMPWAMGILDQSGVGPLVRNAAQPVHRAEVWNGTEGALKLNMDVDSDPNLRPFCLSTNYGGGRGRQAVLAKNRSLGF